MSVVLERRRLAASTISQQDGAKIGAGQVMFHDCSLSCTMAFMAATLNTKQRQFQTRLLAWFAKHRRDLPWRRTRDPYKILVSEIMLQQTQVDRVMPKYAAFINKFPTIQKLARAQRSSVIKLWSGLGYNNRAVRLHQAAHAIVWQHHGTFPRSPEMLERLPGIGFYTARAIGAFAFDEPVAAVDVNHGRVVQRAFFGTRVPSQKKLAALAQTLVPRSTSYEWNHALMDFGALICKSRPRCDICPLRSLCSAYPKVLSVPKTKKQSAEPFLGSNRYFRGRIVETLRNAPHHRLAFPTLWQQIDAMHSVSRTRFRTLVGALENDHIIRVTMYCSRAFVSLA